MAHLIWAGAVVSLIGVGMLMFCVLSALRARRENLSDEALKARLQGLAALNMGALGISTIGLMMVVTGIVFG